MLARMEMTIIEAAQALGVSTNTVRRRLANGVLTGNKVGNQWVINVDDARLELANAAANVERGRIAATALNEKLKASLAAMYPTA